MKYIEKTSKILNDRFTEYVYEAFDIQNSESTTVKIPMNFGECRRFDWNIGIIYGGSGTGKTTLLKEFGELAQAKFSETKPLISNFDWLDPKEATFLLSAMGLASVPTWLRPFGALSNGEQYRAELAYKVGKAKEGETVLIDEYTSVVDRDVAKAMSNALQKYIRRYNKKIVLASCHFDIMEWVLPDWTYSPLKGVVEKHDYRRQSRPRIDLQIFRCRYETWDIFKPYHYLTEDLNKAASAYLTTWNGKPVAFNAVLPFPHGNIQNGYRMSRTVVLPDYQGLGFGSKITDYISSLYAAEGRTMYAKTSNPALWHHRDRSDNWLFTNEIKKEDLGTDKIDKMKAANDMGGTRNAITKSYKFIGEPSKDSTDIIMFKAENYKHIAQNQIPMF